MIPKIIHYCWFGNGEIPEKDKKCIESWKKYCPDYEIKMWNESNYDITKNTYMYEAYKAQKWGFVPDYARLDIIYNYGGFYLDTDVELLKSLDTLVDEKAYMGFEDKDKINPGLGFGAEEHHPGIKKLLSIYENRHFLNEDGSLNLIPSPILHSEFLEKSGAKKNDELQIVEGIKLFPTEYFCPKSFITGEITLSDKTYSIHHFNMSWVDEEDRKWILREQILVSKIGKKLGGNIIKVARLPGKVYNKLAEVGVLNTIKYIGDKIKKEL